MSSGQSSEGRVQAHVRNIGGISETTVTLTPGVSVLAGRNATNRTSLLRAIMLGLGSDIPALKGDADSGSVTLDVGGETYTRELTRQGDEIRVTGEPFLADAEVADLFAFLLEDNSARVAVARDADLREIIMRPIDTGAIQREIERLQRRRDALDAELESIDDAQQRLPELEAERNRLETELAEKREALEATETAIESMDADVEETKQERDELEATLASLRETRAQLDELRDRIDAKTQAIDSLEAEQQTLTEELDALAEAQAVDITELEAEIEQLRARKQTLESVVTELQSVVQFNEEMLTGDRAELHSALELDTDGAVTDQLVDERTVCWTCGSEIDVDAIESTLSELRAVRANRLEQIESLESEIEQRRTQVESVTTKRDRRAELESRLSEIDEELHRRRSRLEELRTQKSTVTDELQQLEAEVETLEAAEFDAVLEKHRQANELQYEIGRLETDLEGVQDEIHELEAPLETRESVRTERDQVQSALVDARTRIERVETEAVNEFNQHMATVLEVLGYENLDRVWIEQRDEQVQDGRQTVSRSHFELHVIRTNEAGQAYEDTIAHLSESEREVVGLVFALAGYLVHDVHETLPFILLDSLEAIDSDRIATLVEYFSDYAAYPVVALLPEDERSLPDSYTRIRNI